MRITTVTAWRLHFKKGTSAHTKHLLSAHHHHHHHHGCRCHWNQMGCSGNLLGYKVGTMRQDPASSRVDWRIWWPRTARPVSGRCFVNTYLQSDEGLGKFMVCLSNLHPCTWKHASLASTVWTVLESQMSDWGRHSRDPFVRISRWRKSGTP